MIEQCAKSQGGNAERLIEPEGLSWKIALRLPHAPALEAQPELIRHASPSQRVAERTTPGPACAGLRFLIVEDEPLIAMELADRLTKLGAETVSVSTENECMNVIQTDRFDCALLDANLHGHPVDAIAASLTSRRIPFAFVTGYGRAGLPASFQQVLTLAKPLSTDQLLEAIKFLVTQPRRVVALPS